MKGIFSLVLLAVLAVPVASNWNDFLLRLYNFVAGTKNECRRIDVTECTCYEILQVNRFHVQDPPQPMKDSDIKQGYLKSSKYYHPDRKGGDAESFRFLKACYDKLRYEDKRRRFSSHIRRLEAKNLNENLFRAFIQDLNDIVIVGQEKETFIPRQPRASANDPKIERLFFFADDSGSMQSSNAIDIAHAALWSIEDRIERTPTSVHFIGSASYQKFRFEDDITVHDIVKDWTGKSGGTMLWEYVFNAVMSQKRVAGGNKDELVVITDGLDNKSSGHFRGIEGYQHMMTEFKKTGIKLRINILCIGNEDECKSPHYRDLAAATGGFFSNVDPHGTTTANLQQQMLPFTNHMLSSNAARDQKEIEHRKDYEARLASGNALTLPFYDSLISEGTPGASGKPKTTDSQAFKFETIEL